MATLAPARRVFPVMWGFMFLVLLLFVGLRHKVGMDWPNYLKMIEWVNDGTWQKGLLGTEPGYAALLLISGKLGLGIYATYFMGTLIFLAGLLRYARTTPYPWLALTVAMPFLVIVIGMSAARQTVAIGVLFWLVAVWYDSSVFKRVGLVLLASSFHISSIVFLMLVLVDLKIGYARKVVLVTLGALGSFYMVLVSERVDEYQYYIYGNGENQILQSQGAIFHVLINALPAIMAFMLGRRIRSVLLPDELHVKLAIIAIILLPASMFTPVGAGRFTLYLFPVCMMVLSSLPSILRTGQQAMLLRFASAMFFLFFLFFWLNYSNTGFVYHNYSNALPIDPNRLILCCR